MLTLCKVKRKIWLFVYCIFHFYQQRLRSNKKYKFANVGNKVIGVFPSVKINAKYPVIITRISNHLWKLYNDVTFTMSSVYY